MSDFTVTEHNAITNEVTVRNMIDEEIAYIEEQRAIFEKNLAKITAKEEARKALELALTDVHDAQDLRDFRNTRLEVKKGVDDILSKFNF